MSEKSIYSKIKEAFRHSVIYGMGKSLSSILSFVLIPIYTNYYTTDMYGTLALINICGTIGGAIFYFGVHSALGRSYYDHKEGRDRKTIVSTTFFILLGGAFIQIALAVIFNKKLSLLLFENSTYGILILFTLVKTALQFVSNLFYMLLRFSRRSKLVIKINIIFLLISTVLILYFLVILQIGIWAPVLGTLIAASLKFATLFLYTRKSFIFAFSVPEMKIQLKWGFAVVLSNFAVLSLNWSDRFILNHFTSLGDIGIYSLGYKIGTIITIILVYPFNQIWEPMRMEYRKDKNANKFYGLALTYFIGIGMLFFVGLSLFTKEILTLLVSRVVYIEAYKVVPPIVLSYLIVGSGNLTNHGVVFKRKVHYGVPISWANAIINVLLNIILIPRFGYIAAAYTTLFSFALGRSIGLYINNKLYKIPYEGKRIMIIVGSAISIFYLSHLFSFPNLLSALLIKVILILFMITIWYLFAANRKEREIISKLYTR